MNKKAAVGALVAVLLLTVLVSTVAMTEWNTSYDTPQEIPFTGEDADEDVFQSSLNYNLLETYGPVLLVLSILMFGAIIGGVCVAREEVEQDDTN